MSPVFCFAEVPPPVPTEKFFFPGLMSWLKLGLKGMPLDGRWWQIKKCARAIGLSEAVSIVLKNHRHFIFFCVYFPVFIKGKTLPNIYLEPAEGFRKSTRV